MPNGKNHSGNKDTTRRPWWKRKRWRLTLAAWLMLPVVHVAGVGPHQYCIARGWDSPVPPGFHRPLKTVLTWTGHRTALDPYRKWWFDLAKRHEAEAEVAPG